MHDRVQQCLQNVPPRPAKKVAALTGLTLSVSSHEVFGCIGPNGAGKSTTIKLLLDLIRPDSGSITINGQSTSNEASARGWVICQRTLISTIFNSL